MPAAIFARSCSRSAMMSCSFLVVPPTALTISPTSSSASYAGNGDEISPCSNSSKRTLNSFMGSAIPLAIFRPITLAIRAEQIIIAIIAITKTIVKVANWASFSSPNDTLASIRLCNAAYASSYAGAISLIAISCACLLLASSFVAPSSMTFWSISI